MGNRNNISVKSDHTVYCEYYREHRKRIGTPEMSATPGSTSFFRCQCRVRMTWIAFVLVIFLYALTTVVGEVTTGSDQEQRDGVVSQAVRSTQKRYGISLILGVSTISFVWHYRRVYPLPLYERPNAVRTFGFEYPRTR